MFFTGEYSEESGYPPVHLMFILHGIACKTEGIWRKTDTCLHVYRKTAILYKIIIMKAGDYVVELDQFKATLNTFKDPLQEVRDSLWPR